MASANHLARHGNSKTMHAPGRAALGGAIVITPDQSVMTSADHLVRHENSEAMHAPGRAEIDEAPPSSLQTNL